MKRSINVSTSIKLDLLSQLKQNDIKVSQALEIGARKLLGGEQDINVAEYEQKIERLALLLEDKNREIEKLKEEHVE